MDPRRVGAKMDGKAVATPGGTSAEVWGMVVSSFSKFLGVDALGGVMANFG